MAGETVQAIDPIAIVALGGCVPTKDVTKAKADVLEGMAAGFDMTVKLAGTVERGEPTEVDPTCDLFNEWVFAELMRRLGVTKASWEKHLLEISLEANVQGVKLRDQVRERSPELATTLELLKRDVVSKMAKRPRAGAIKVTCSKLDFARVKVERKA